MHDYFFGHKVCWKITQSIGALQIAPTVKKCSILRTVQTFSHCQLQILDISNTIHLLEILNECLYVSNNFFYVPQPKFFRVSRYWLSDGFLKRHLRFEKLPIKWIFRGSSCTQAFPDCSRYETENNWNAKKHPRRQIKDDGSFLVHCIRNLFEVCSYIS